MLFFHDRHAEVDARRNAISPHAGQRVRGGRRERNDARRSLRLLLASAALEQVAAFITTPILMVSYTEYIWALLRGGSVRWDAQPRDDRGLSWHEGWLRLRSHVLVGAGWLVLLLTTKLALLLWATPLLVGLLLAVPAAILSSRATLGLAARRVGLFLTPDEVAPPPILRTYNRLLQPAEGERIRPAPSAPIASVPRATAVPAPPFPASVKLR